MRKEIIMLVFFLLVLNNVFKGVNVFWFIMFKIIDICFCVFSVFFLIVWCLNVVVFFSVVLNVKMILVRFIFGFIFIGVIFLLRLICVRKIFCFSWGCLFKFFVVCFIILYFFKWWINFVCGFFFLLLLFFCFGSNNWDFILVSIVVINKYLVVSLSFNVIMVLIYFMYCLVIIVMGKFVILNFCFWIRYKSKFNGFLKVFRIIFRVLGGINKFLGFLIKVLLLIKVKGSGCWIGVDIVLLVVVILFICLFLC